MKLRINDTLFGEYREVPWLVRNYAVVRLPTTAAFSALVGLPGRQDQTPNNRLKLVGFGDPDFGGERLIDAPNKSGKSIKPSVTEISSLDNSDVRVLRMAGRSSPNTRGLESADLSVLPSLPNTREE